MKVALGPGSLNQYPPLIILSLKLSVIVLGNALRIFEAVLRQINFNKDGNFNDLSLNRLGGKINLKPKSNAFEWDANKFRLDRVEVAFPPEKSFKRILIFFYILIIGSRIL